MTKKEAVTFVLVRSLGNFLVLISLYGVVATFGPAVSAEVQYRIGTARGVRYEVPHVAQGAQVPQAAAEKNTTSGGFADVLAGEKEQVLVPPDTGFSVVIPKIGAAAKVFPNVDPTDEKSFLPVLQQGVAHAKGSVFPGMSGNVYLFAHSTDNWWHVGQYNAIFYLLKDVAVGDEIVVFFEDRRYDYVVSRTLITDPTDVSFLTRGQGGEAQLVLQTCWPPGTTWKRLFVIAEPKGQN